MENTIIFCHNFLFIFVITNWNIIVKPPAEHRPLVVINLTGQFKMLSWS